MARGKKSSKRDVSESVETSALAVAEVEHEKPTPPLTPPPPPTPPPQAEVPIVRKKAGDGKDPQLMMTFQRWFALQGKPPHHKAGMRAFGNTKGKRSIAAWNRMFAAY